MPVCTLRARDTFEREVFEGEVEFLNDEDFKEQVVIRHTEGQAITCGALIPFNFAGRRFRITVERLD